MGRALGPLRVTLAASGGVTRYPGFSERVATDEPFGDVAWIPSAGGGPGLCFSDLWGDGGLCLELLQSTLFYDHGLAADRAFAAATWNNSEPLLTENPVDMDAATTRWTVAISSRSMR